MTVDLEIHPCYLRTPSPEAPGNGVINSIISGTAEELSPSISGGTADLPLHQIMISALKLFHRISKRL
jgi:hypothetical protein